MRHGGTKLATSAALLLLTAACALTPEQKQAVLEQKQARVNSLEQEVVTEMKEVVALMKANHFKPCIEKLHSPNFWGGQYRTAGEFVPSPLYSCVTQGRGSPISRSLRSEDTRSFAVYIVPMKKVGGGFGSGRSRGVVGHCTYKAEKGVVSFVGAAHEMKVHRTDGCLIL